RHRWIRGDWQIASWLLPRVPGGSAAAARNRNPLSYLSQWKILDNLRRSLVPAGLMLLMLLGWTFFRPAWFWTAVVAGIIAIPPLFASALDLLRRPDDVLPRQHLAAALRAMGGHLAQAALTLACLPYEAWYSLDAILRTNWRILVSRTQLLEWSPSSGVERTLRPGLLASCLKMWIAPAIAIVSAMYLARMAPGTLAIASPVLVLWMAAPGLTWWLSRPLPPREARLTGEQHVFLHKLTRQTWAFFETFVGPDDHWLPPDNFQEHPLPVVAHRTSPTNIGLGLLANLAAHDFGYIPAGELIARTASTLETMQGLDRHEGHFYNWYDTQSLRPLSPLYVSSVDSGNLAGNLLTLRPGLLALHASKIAGVRWFEGIADTLRVLTDVAGPAATPEFAQLQRDVESAYDSRTPTLAAMQTWLTRLTASAEQLAAGPALAAAAADSPLLWWTQALTRQCRGALDELTLLAPWLTLTDVPERLRSIIETFEIPTLRELGALDERWLAAIAQRLGSPATAAEQASLDALRQQVATASARAGERIDEIERLAQAAGEMAAMDYGFLYDKARHLLAIGYNVADRRRDASYYDLLASEARLASFVAIAQGQLPQESWFALGRLLTTSGGEPMLLSWSGSMFEYLMPLLIMPTYENTLLDRTYESAIDRQIAYANQRGVAWGISECGYNTVDAALNYQYRAFGVPGLGLKRGLAEDMVIAPYASALALMVAPERACTNLERLASEGLMGRYGFYEAVDYTASRLPRGQSSAVIRSFMAHHQGMIFLSLTYLLLDRPMQKRFESDPQFQATMLLLQERVPKAGAFQLHTGAFSALRATVSEPEMPVRVIRTPGTPTPEVQLLSNSRYHVMVTNAGGGYSRWKDLAVTRWREDTTCDNWGAFCYLRDVASGVFWSNTHQPTLKRAETYEAIFSEGRAEFRRRDLDYETHTEIVVSPEDDIELRRIRITNRSRVRRTIEVTTYAEVVLAVPAADALHPAFSNLFVQTEIVRERQAILCTRRPRSVTEHAPWLLHLMALRGAEAGEISYETDRMRFIGRGRTVAAPHALGDCSALSGSAGSVLDPVIAIRCRITLDPEQAVTIDTVTGIGTTRDAALNLAGKYQDRHLADRVFELAWTHSQVVLRQINASEADTQLYGRLASAIIYANSSLRADAGVLSTNRRGQSGLWGYAISGDLPIVLLQIGDLENIDLVRQLVQAHAYWRLKGLTVDLVVWNEDRAGYRQVLQEQIMGLIAAGVEAHVMDKPGGIFVRRAEQISKEDRILVQAVARAIISDRRGSLGDQINRRGLMEVRAPHLNLPRFKATRTHRPEPAATTTPPRTDLVFGNGLGGFSADGREYVITTTHAQVTPAPWVNVLANPYFGCVISESGMTYTWSENAHEFRLTPWANDAVSDAGGEAFYIRDEETGHFWSPSPSPCRGAAPYVSRHGFGYSTFEYAEGGIRSELTVYVALDAAVKFSVLKIANTSGRPRRLCATGYAEWVLGDLQPKTAMHVITEIDPASGGLCARNAYNTEFAERTAFFDVDDATRTVSGDRAEFIGR
ncbi:MAG: glucoamylase family protein, partial [Burkholderiales bacterium]